MDFIQAFLRHYKYAIPKADWDWVYVSDDNFPDLECYGEALDYFGIDNIVALVPKDFFDDLPEVFLSLLLVNRTHRIVYTDKNNPDKIIATDRNGKTYRYTKTAFLEVWTGEILCIEENTNPQDTIHERIDFLAVFGYISTISAVLSGIYLVWQYNILRFFDLYSIGFFAIGLIGLLLSIVAVKESLNFKSRKLSDICASIPNGDCNKVILSPGSQLLKGITLSDVSFIYFAFTVIASCFMLPFHLHFPLLVMASLAIPVVVYSVYLQARSSAWCVICLGISFAALFQFLLQLSFYSSFAPKFEGFALSGFLFLLLAASWFNSKPYFAGFSLNNLGELRLNSFKRQDGVFDFLIKKSREMNEDGFDNIKMLLLDANNKAKINVVAIINPVCSSCTIVYEHIKQLQRLYPERMHFSLFFRNIGPENASVISRIFEIYDNGTANELRSSLDDLLLSQLTTQRWLKKWGTAQNDYTDVFAQQQIFIDSNQLYNTPTVIVNNHVLPLTYKVNDLPFFLAEIESYAS